MSRTLLAGAAVLLALAAAPATAQEAGETPRDLTCPDAGVIGPRMITDICWDCIFPIRIGGFTFAGNGDVPDTATGQSLCSCDDQFGIPHPGITMGMWTPSLLVELVRSPGCIMSLGGQRLPLADRRFMGTRGYKAGALAERAYFHYHIYAFPLLVALELMTDPRCNAGGYGDIDLMYVSELDPTWAEDELAFFVNPEVSLVANPIGWAACPIDAAAANTGEPLDDLWWCVGSWGWLYPLSGRTFGGASLATQTSHLASRALAAQHRRGLLSRTVGDDALCWAPYEPMFVKSQYRMSMFAPVPEANGKHVIGQSALAWGEWRQIPGVGEDASYIVWRWRDCCATF